MHETKSPADCPQDPCPALAAFIRDQADAIFLRWTEVPYADAGVSGGAALHRFRHEVNALLEVVANSVDNRNPGENRVACEPASLSVGAERYALTHLTCGLTELQLVLVLQALRKAVLELWMESLNEASAQPAAGILRLNLIFDNALAAAMDHYCRIRDRCHGLFMKKLAHDLRNPLGGIELTTQVLQQSAHLAAADIDKLASGISRSAGNAVRVTDEIYDIGSMRDGLGIVVNPVELDVAALCRKAADELMSRYPGQALSLDAAGPIMGAFDEARIAQAFFNLISYAFRHTDRQQPVQVSLLALPDALLFSVRYLSALPAPDDAEAMFAPMRRYASHVLSKKGPISELGIDLLIAREIIVAHEGEINAFVDQEWMTFEARLPV